MYIILHYFEINSYMAEKHVYKENSVSPLFVHVKNLFPFVLNIAVHNQYCPCIIIALVV